MTSNPKNFIKSLFIRKHTFENGGSILNLDFKLADLLAELQTLQPNSKGYIRLSVAEKRPENQEEGKSTHYAYENTYHGGAGSGEQKYASVQEAAQAQDTINVEEAPF